MPYRKVKLLNNCHYHVYNRGVNKEEIFFNDDNYYYFLDKLQNYLSDSADVVAYCLMPNHFHLLLRIKDESNITKSLTRLFVSYSKAINTALNRRGRLFEGRYKAKLIPTNNYLLHLSRYIHLNPVRAGLVEHSNDWKFSSYQFYTARRQNTIVKNKIVLDQVSDYETFVENYGEKNSEIIAELLFSSKL